MAAMVRVQDLVKRFMPADVLAVNGVSFDIQEGEIFSLLGPNGAGKTTTISMLSGLLSPTSGDATIGGHSIVKRPMEVKRIIGVVPQEVALYDALSARENLMFWGQLYAMHGAALRSRVAEVLEQVGLTERAGGKIKDYSGGMKRRVNIAVGLLHKPQIVFMDEPTVGIDPQSRRSILDMVKHLNRQGMTVLYTTHYMEEAQELSDRVGIMDHGEMIAIGTQRELTQMVGEHETLRLHLSEGDPVHAIAQQVGALDLVLQASSADNKVMVVVAEADEALAPVIAAANDAGARVRSVDIEEPNLESVFLHLTGRALRD